MLTTLVFFMPAILWSETVVWVSGYANYVTAAILMLVFLRFVLLELAGVHAQPFTPMRGVGIFCLSCLPRSL